MAQSLAVTYRPHKFENVLSQTTVIKILKKQLENKLYTNCYLFCGPSGDGKTTLARIFASEINAGKGSPIEIDAASHNGVEDIRNIIDSANQRSLDSEYKIYIIDECHAISSSGWQAFLKCIEEPPKYTIFMFCTTNPEKIPATIINRVMRFNLTKVPTELIAERLKKISEFENYINYNDSCEFIAKLANGGVRDAISMLEKCANYSSDLNITNVLEVLGDFSYDTFFTLSSNLLNQDEASVLEIITNFYNSGKDLRLFVEKYLDFCLDLTKYCLFKDMSVVKIPNNLQSRCDAYSNIPDILHYSNTLCSKLLELKNMIKYDTSYFLTVQVVFIQICRGV